jgi:hypothetical protein
MDTFGTIGGFMRHTSAVALLLLAGCATAPRQASMEPEPQRHVIRPAPGTASLTVTDSAKRATIRQTRIEIVNGACQTNDPMPTGHYGPSMLPSSLAIPNAQTLRPPAYIPNACPVTAGPLATQSVPAVNSRSPKVIPQAEPRGEAPGQP